MLRKISYGLLCAGALFSTTTIAMTHELAPRVSIEYELNANVPEVFTNYTIFTVNATCTVKSQDESNIIHVKALNRSGSINGKDINAGDELDLVVKNNDTFTLSAKSAAKVEMTNTGAHSLKALCRT
ncbi:MAG: hypothetical protein Q8M03_11900 [Legionella sp.]|nr:hypothetical protein [Legionella sp.]